jgi:twinkle protein
MTPREISERMANDAEGICSAILPAGKRVGNNWCVGSIAGEPGDSMKVCISGSKAGLWADFAGHDKGDMIDLLVKVRGLTVADAIDFGKKWCGITDPTFTSSFKPKKAANPIQPLKSSDNTKAVIDWFAARGIAEETLKAYRIVSQGTTVAFPCYIGNDLMHTKYRDTAKPKKEAFSTSKNSTPILFGWQSIPKNAREVVITEGECDAMVYHQQGFNALSVPMGAGRDGKQQWLDYDYDRLERFDYIYLSMDMDEAGQDSIQYIANRIGLHRCKVVVLPEKDANDCLIKGIALSTFVESAKTIDPVELRRSSEFLDDVEELFRPTKTTLCGKTLPWERTEDKFLIRPGELTVWTGFNGSGKSMLISHVIVGLIAQDERACVASMEMAAPITLKRMFQQIGATPTPPQEFMFRIDDWINGRLWIVNIRGTTKSDRLMEIFKYAWKRYGITQIVIDSLLKCGFAEDDYNGQKEFIDRLCDFISETKCHIHLVSHSRKMESEFKAPGKMDVRGGAALTDLPDNVISVWRNKAKEDAIHKHNIENQGNPIPIPASLYNKPDCVMQIHKQRHHDWEGKIPLWFDRQCHQYYIKEKQPRSYL